MNDVQESHDNLCPQCLLTDQRIASIETRLAVGDTTLAMLPQLLSEMKTMTNEVSKLRKEVAKTAEIVVAWGNIKGFGRAMRFLSTILKTSAIITTGFATLWLLFTHQDKPALDLLKTLTDK